MCRSHDEGGRRCPADQAPKTPEFKAKDAARKRAERAAKRGDLGVSASPIAFDPAAVEPTDLTAFAANPPEGVREWMQKMADEGKGNNGGELEQWYDKAFPENQNTARDLVADDAVWELMMSPWRKQVTETVRKELHYSPHADADEDTDKWVEKVLKKARAKTKREVGRFSNINAGYVAGYGGDEVSSMAVKVGEYAASEARAKANAKPAADARAKRRARDAEIAAEYGITDNTPIHKVHTSTLGTVSATSSPETGFGTDYPQRVTVVERKNEPPLELTTAEIAVGSLVWKRAKRHRGKTSLIASRVVEMKPFGVHNGVLYSRVVTAPADADERAWLIKQEEYLQLDRKGGFA